MFHFFTPWRLHKVKCFLTLLGVQKWNIGLKWVKHNKTEFLCIAFSNNVFHNTPFYKHRAYKYIVAENVQKIKHILINNAQSF